MIYTWIADRSEAGANRWYEVARQAIKSLEHDANQQEIAPEAHELGLELRQKLFKTRRGRI